MSVKIIFLCIIGLAAGFTVSAGVFAFISSLQIIPKLAARTNTAKCMMWYEDCVTLGGTLGNVILLFQIPFPLGMAGLAVTGIFGGMFVGCMAVALAEVVDAFPVFSRRIRLSKGFVYIMGALAIGKGIGAILFFSQRW
jgi:stage V sporulation protein AB